MKWRNAALVAGAVMGSAAAVQRALTVRHRRRFPPLAPAAIKSPYFARQQNDVRTGRLRKGTATSADLVLRSRQVAAQDFDHRGVVATAKPCAVSGEE